MLELGTLMPINHKNNLNTLEKRIETLLEIFEKAYANDRAISEENQRAFELIYRSIGKCLKINPKKRPDFIQLFGENIKNTMDKGKIKFFIAVKEKRIDELENIDWEEAKKQEAVINPNPEVISQLNKDLNEKNKEIKFLKEENKKLAIENALLREENKRLTKEKIIEVDPFTKINEVKIIEVDSFTKLKNLETSLKGLKIKQNVFHENDYDGFN